MIRRLLPASTLGLVLVGCAWVNRAQSVEFHVDLGQIDPIGDLSWDYTLGPSWNDDFSIGGIVGKKDAVVTPEVNLGLVTIPEWRADTRTGARMSGRVSGGAGLLFTANFDPSRLLQESTFQFEPTVATPSDVSAGEFFALATKPGLDEDAPFGEEQVHLPSFDAGMSIFFNLDLKSKIEGGLFPIIPYDSTNFNLDIEIDEPLVNFKFDLDRKDGIPPTLTLFPGNNFVKQEIKFLDDQASVVSQQISVHFADENNPAAPPQRLDVGEVQLVNPFGAETDAGGTKTNLTVSTSLGERSIDYSFETPLLRLGLDVDGIAGFLATAALSGVGNSFTRIEEDIEINNKKIAEITADLIDIKYGPELGYRESVEIKPDFDVTLTFKDNMGDLANVAVKTDGVISVTSSTPGNWNDLPEISLLDDQEVQVTVTFNKLTGEQTKRGSFYLTDYLELTLLEIEDVTILDTVSLSLPPLIQERTSLLGKLLGQVELDVFNGSQAIDDPSTDDDDIKIIQSEVFTFPLKAKASSRLYRSADRNPDDPTATADWRSLDNHTTPSSLDGKVLVIGLGSQATTHVGELTPMDFDDEPNETVSLGQLFQQQTGLHPGGILSPSRSTLYPDPGEPIDVEGLEIIAGSRYLHTSGGIRRWTLPSIRNDGQFRSTRSTEIVAKDELLQLTGSGSMAFQGPTAIRAATLFNGEGHTLAFLDAVGLNLSEESVTVRYSVNPFTVLEIPVTVPSVSTDDRPLKISDNIQNAGTIRFGATNANVTLGSRFANASTGTLLVDGGSAVVLIAPRIVQDGLVAVNGNSALQIHDGSIITTEGTTGTFEAAGGGYLRFLASSQNPIKIGEVESLNFNDLPPEKSLTFRAASGGEVSFFPAIEQRFDIRSRFETEPGGTMRLNGLSFPDIAVPNTDKHPEYTEAASQFIEVINRGTLIVQSGRNNLFLDPEDPLCTGTDCDPPKPPVPFVVPINLVNEGTVQIEAGAEFGFQVEIQDYAEGGAKLVGGTWKLMGATNVRGSNLVVPPASHEPLDRDLAVLNIEVVKVSDDDNILGSPFNIGDFDTELAINAANVTLSGQAVFPYFNTVRENEGVINLENYAFNTDGDLVNRGEIHLTDNSVLALHGALTIDEGNVTLESGSTLVIFPNAISEPISVIGGSLTWPNPTGSDVFEEAISSLRWVVREKWFEDEEGNEVIVPSRVDFGEAQIRTINVSGDFLLDGAQASMDSLAALEKIRGKLTLAGGNELRLEQSLNNEGMLRLEKAANLYVDGQLTSSRQLAVGPDTYLEVSGSIHATDGSVELGGLVHATDVTTSATTVLSGSGELTGSLNMGGGFLASITEPGMDVTGLLVHGQTMLGGDLLVHIDGYIPQAGEELSILIAKGGLAGAFSNVSHGQRLFTNDGIGSFLVRYGTIKDPNHITLTAFEPTGDYNGDGTFDAADYVVWRKLDGSQLGYETWRANFGRAAAGSAAGAAVPEPTSLILLAAALVGLCGRRNRGGVFHALDGRIG